MSITLDWIKISCKNIWEDAAGPCGDDYVTNSRNRKLIRVTSSNEDIQHKCVDLIDYNIHLNQTYIWTKFDTEYKCHTVDTPEWPNSHNLKNKMAAAAILNFGKMAITPDWITISAPNFTWRCITAMRGWPRDQIRVTSSNERLQHKCVDLSDYNIYLNQIWYRTQMPHCRHAAMAKFA